MIFKRIIFLIAIGIVQQAAAQKASIKASVDKQKILIGQPLQLTIEAVLPANGAAKFPSIDTIPHFEFAAEPVTDSSVSGNNTTIKKTYTLTSFDSGRWAIPSFALARNTRSDTIPIDVVFSEFDPAKDYNDIKDILDVKVVKKQFPWWWYAAGGLLLLIVIYLVLKKKRPVVEKAVLKSTVSPFDEAIQAMELLEKTKPETKQYYSKLTDIFRLYLYRKKGILSLQKTTDDLGIQLRNLDLGKEQFDKLSKSLRLSDFVKFAKYVPAEEDDRSAFRDVLQAIKAIEQAETK
jgi:hypothetical protein